MINDTRTYQVLNVRQKMPFQTKGLRFITDYYLTIGISQIYGIFNNPIKRMLGWPSGGAI